MKLNPINQEPTYREMVRALVVHIIVLAPAFNHLQVALGVVDPREVTHLGRARGCVARHLQTMMGRGEETPATAEDCRRSVLGLGIGEESGE